MTSAIAVPADRIRRQLRDAADPEPCHDRPCRAVVGPSLDRVDAGDAGGDEEPVPSGRGTPTTTSRSGTTVVQSPGAVGIGSRSSHDAPLGRVERGRSDQPVVGGEHQVVRLRRRRQSACATARWSVEQVLIAAAPSDHRVHQHETPVRRDPHLRPGLGRRVIGPHDRIVGPRLAERVMVHRAVVLVALGVAGVEEPRAVGFPGHAGGTAVGDLVDQQRAVGRSHDPKTEFSVPPSLTPTATNSPSVEGKNQSIATAASSHRPPGRSGVTDARPDRTTIARPGGPAAHRLRVRAGTADRRAPAPPARRAGSSSR